MSSNEDKKNSDIVNSVDDASKSSRNETITDSAKEAAQVVKEKDINSKLSQSAKQDTTVDEEKKDSTNDKADNSYYPEEEVLEGDWMRPQVDIKEVQVQTGEEDETCFWSHRAKLYRWAKASSEWKERGIGEAKLLQHKGTNKIRFLLRQEKTLKIVANHYIVPHKSFCHLTPNVGSDKIWVWSVVDFSEDEGKLEQFALKFGQVAAATEFKNKFEEAAKLNETLFEAFIEKSQESVTTESK